MVGWGMMWGPCWVGRSTFVSDVCNVPVVVVRCVRHNLNAAVRQGNPVTALLHWENLASTNSIIFFISSFSSLLFTRLWRVPATQPYPTWNFFYNPIKRVSLQAFRVQSSNYNLNQWRFGGKDWENFLSSSFTLFRNMHVILFTETLSMNLIQR